MVGAKSQGVVWLLKHQGDPRQPWQATKIDALTTSHHLGWADVDGDGKKELINAPLIGPQAWLPSMRTAYRSSITGPTTGSAG